ncbi:MAG: IPTL-CTERM sorting domain-containing protein [Deltaproteobacteria bacterium]|nr:IPTL-CTERM sorting domain-containing protein [Deltaproteobacteria bacterium]
MGKKEEGLMGGNGRRRNVKVRPGSKRICFLAFSIVLSILVLGMPAASAVELSTSNKAPEGYIPSDVLSPGNGITIPPGATPEGEPDCYDNYVDATNGGCNWDPVVFGSASCDEIISGTAGNYICDESCPDGAGTYRDTDWFEVTVGTAQQITMTAMADFPVLIGIIDGNSGCPVTGFMEFALGDAGVETSVSANVGPGTYYLFIATQDFTGTPCGSNYYFEYACGECSPTADAGGPLDPICAGDTVQLGGDPTASGGVGPYTYSWSPDTWLDSTSSSRPTVSPSGTCTPSSSQTYTLVVTDTGCNSATASYQVKIKVCCKPEADAGPDKEICQGKSTVLGPDNGVNNGNYGYSWTPDTYLDDPTLKNPTASTATDTPSGSITYTVVVTELDCNSCTDSDEMVLTIHENPDCTITVDEGASDGYVEPGSTHTAWIATPNAGAADVTWTVVDSDMKDLIQGSNKDLTVTFVTPLEPSFIKISVAMEDNNECTCSFDPPLIVHEPDPLMGVLKVYRYIPALGSWGLIGLAALIAGAGAWIVRRRKKN